MAKKARRTAAGASSAQPVADGATTTTPTTPTPTPSSTFGQQLQATLLRNVRLKLRDSRKTMAEVFLPLYTLSTLILLKILIPNPNFPAVLQPQPAVGLFDHFALHHNHTVAVLPAANGSVATRQFLDAVNELWTNMSAATGSATSGSGSGAAAPLAGRPPDIQWQLYDTQDDLLAAYWRAPAAMPMAIVFHGPDPMRGRLSYELRTNPTFAVTPAAEQLFATPAACRQTPAEMSMAAIQASDAADAAAAEEWEGGGAWPTNVVVGGFPGGAAAGVLDATAADSCPGHQYLYSGFVAMQALLDYTKIRLASSNLRLGVPDIRLERFPKRAYTGNWMVAFRLVIPIYMVMALSQFITYLLILIVGEKETRVKEGLKIMGLRDAVYWTAWFVIYAAFVAFLAVVSVVLLFSLGVFRHTHALPVFVLILLYSWTVILIGFMITPFFDNSRTAGILGNFAVNIMSLLYFIQVFVADDSGASAVLLWAVSLISPTGFALAMDKILVLDIAGQGVTTANLWQGPGIPLGGSILMMAVDIVLYAAIAFWLDSVVPGEHGTKRSPCFCFSRKYWRTEEPEATAVNGPETSSPSSKAQLLNGGGGGGSRGCLESEAAQQQQQLRNDVEPVPPEWHGREAIRIVDLHKTFHSCRKPEVRAVNGINLTIYEGQITAILGHNGAGKSTLFNILTGLTAPTAGTAYIFGYDIRDANDMTMIRRMTGVCPQHDILFEHLTPREHLYFFAAVRGIRPSHIKREVKKTLRDVDLHERADAHARHLSGGQKRKLSVGIAIIGDPKIIILDEPTAGVDPYSRRHLWQILQRIKRGKCILLTTHFMDEADVLADRKAVVSRGRLRCCGSSLFLKNKFGIGYHLTLVLAEAGGGDAGGGGATTAAGVAAAGRELAITALVNRHVPQAERARRHGRELSYILPHDAVDSFAPLFVDIERAIEAEREGGGAQTETAGRTNPDTAADALPAPERLGISSYGVSMTTLEEVFLHLETQRDGEEGTTSGSAVTAASGGDGRAGGGGTSACGVDADASSASAAAASAAGETDDCTGLGKHMVRNRALSRSVSLQGGLRSEGSAEMLPASVSPLPSMSIATTAHRRQPSAGSRTTATVDAGDWLELDGLQLRPSAGRTLLAMLRLRCVIMGRDLQRLYLMIVLPLAFTAIGLYLNSIQVIMPVMRAGALNASTYAGLAGRLAVYDATGNPDGADFRYIVAQLNGTTTTSGASSSMEETEEDEAAAATTMAASEAWGGNYSQLLAVEPHMGALRVEALSWSQVTVRALYNDTAQHSLPIVLNLLSNALYRMNVLDDYQPIELRTHPFRPTAQPAEFNLGTFSTSLFVGMIFVLIPVSLAVDMVYDRELKTRNQLRVNGLSSALYFAAYFVIIAALMALISGCLLGMVFLFDIPAFRQPAALLTLGLLIVLYCPAAILCATSCTYLFDRSDSAQSILPNVLTFVGLIPFVLVIFLDMLGIEPRAAHTLHCLCSLLCPVYLPYAAVYFVDRVYVACRLSNACATLRMGDYMTDEVLWMAAGAVLHVPVWTVVLRVVDVWKSGGRMADAFRTEGQRQGALTKRMARRTGGASDSAGTSDFEDADVRAERQRVHHICSQHGLTGVQVLSSSSNGHHHHQRQMGHPPTTTTTEITQLSTAAATTTSSSPTATSPVILVHDLRKEFHAPRASCCASLSDCTTTASPAHHPSASAAATDPTTITNPSAPRCAVRSLSLAVDAGEVLGLLGHNGAGKTTTMRIMTGETAATRGQVRIGAHSVHTARREAFAQLGYCPQHDALWQCMTVREHLEVYAAIRGVPRARVRSVIGAYLRGLRIAEHAHKQTQHCSGGTRRKLSYAMAMIGGPRVVLLDEPSTGMDPKSKRFLWDTILASFQRGRRGAVLTTHSMEEADALCSRVGIMVRGELRCLGSTQHLKNLYGAGYTLEVKLRGETAATVAEAAAKAAAEAVVGVDRAATSATSVSSVAMEERSGGRTVVKMMLGHDEVRTEDDTVDDDEDDDDDDDDEDDSNVRDDAFASVSDASTSSCAPMAQTSASAAAAAVAMAAATERRAAALRAFVRRLFPSACLEESFADRLVYSVPQLAVSSLAECFAQLERAKTELGVEEYSFSQTTLEQVFLKFAHYDEEDGGTNTADIAAPSGGAPSTAAAAAVGSGPGNGNV